MAEKKSTELEQGDELVTAILNTDEGDRFDVKRVGRVEGVIKTVSAMANTAGGTVVVGIEDKRKAEGKDRVYGLEEKPECLGELQRALLSRLTPRLGEPDCRCKMLEVPCTLRGGSCGTIALLGVPKSNAVHSLVDGGTYARYGSQNRQLSAQEITNLSLRRGVQSAVDALSDAPFELLETDYWREYKEQRQLTREFPDALKHLGLARTDESGSWRPTVAAVLLFAEHPGGLLKKKCAIRIFQYKGHQIEYEPNTNLARTPITIDGPIIYQIRVAAETVLRELESGVQVSANGFEYAQKYPPRVVQEAITNAVIHRDYRLSQDIQIRIFTNRIEVESPGVFPGAVTSENVREIGSRPRNRAVVSGGGCKGLEKACSQGGGQGSVGSSIRQGENVIHA